MSLWKSTCIANFKYNSKKNSLFKYVVDTLDDPQCGKDKIPRVFLLGRFVQAFLLNSQFFENQYDELIDSMRRVNLPVNDVLVDGEAEIGDAVELQWDNVKMYDDPNLILKKYGGWAISRSTRMLTPKDQLMMRLTGCTLDEILAGVDVPDSPRGVDPNDMLATAHRSGKRRTSQRRMSLKKGALGRSAEETPEAKKEDEKSEDSDHPSDFEVDPEHPKVVPLGLTVCEMFLLLRGVLVGDKTRHASWKNCVVGQQITRMYRDSHLLAAAVLVDLYMRDQINVHHWTLSEGNIAVAYRLQRRTGISIMDHFLDLYLPHVETIFRDMHLPKSIGEGPIWKCLEERGVIENHRPSWERVYGLGFRRVDVWDLARPDLLLDLKECYLLAARVLYDQSFPDPLHEESNDVLMFCYVTQCLFDHSFECIDAMSRVLKKRCPPFQKGELYPPVVMVHSGAVCLGLIDRAFRVGSGQDSQLALEAAEFNEIVMDRLEEKFFLSPNVWESFDADQSGEISLTEFVEGMRSIDVYKDFRKERVPEDVLRMIVTDLAMRLFHEVDVDGDGTLTQEELQAAFLRRREEAIKQRDSRQWVRRSIHAALLYLGLRKETRRHDERRVTAAKVKDSALNETRVTEVRRRHEWACEVDRVELLDEHMDVDTRYAEPRW